MQPESQPTITFVAIKRLGARAVSIGSDPHGVCHLKCFMCGTSWLPTQCSTVLAQVHENF